MKAIADLTRECLELEPVQRIKLARALLEATDSDATTRAEVEAQWESEIGARLDAVKNGTARSRPAVDVFADLDRKFPA